MKINYPVKYSVMPVYEHMSDRFWLNEFNKDYKIVGFIVSKCYLVSETKNYNVDGVATYDYKVVYPYQIDCIEDNKSWSRVDPNASTTTSSVSSLYENFASAKAVVDMLNQRLNIKDESIKLKLEYLEKAIDDSTRDMNVSYHTRKQRLIVQSHDEMQEVNMSLYDFISAYRETEFYVVSIDEDKFNNKEELTYDSYGDSYLIINDINNNLVRVANKDSNGTQGAYLDEGKDISFYSNSFTFNNDPLFNKLKSGRAVKVYTLETYEDVLVTYLTNYNKTISLTEDNIKKLSLKK